MCVDKDFALPVVSKYVITVAAPVFGIGLQPFAIRLGPRVNRHEMASGTVMRLLGAIRPIEAVSDGETCG